MELRVEQNEVKTLVVVNPAAREGEVGRRWPQLEREVLGKLTQDNSLSGPVRVVQTEASDRGAHSVRSAISEGFRRIFVVGGDGTLSDVVAACFENGKVLASDLCVGVLPCGRGDDFFRSLMRTKPEQWREEASGSVWQKGLKLLAEGSPKGLDVGLLRFDGSDLPRPWVNVVSFGFPGLVVQKVKDKTPFLGLPLGGSLLASTGATYLAQSISALFDYRALKMRVTVDGQEVFSGPAFGAFVLNGAYNAGGICWSNQARIDDGLLEVLVIEPQGFFGLLRFLPQMATGQWGDSRGVHRVRGKKVRVELMEEERKRHSLFDVDGDQPEPEECRGGEIEILQQPLQIWR